MIQVTLKSLYEWEYLRYSLHKNIIDINVKNGVKQRTT